MTTNETLKEVLIRLLIENVSEKTVIELGIFYTVSTALVPDTLKT